VTLDSTFYTQVNMTRTIEQILGIKPMNQFDLAASPMSPLFVDNPPADNFRPWTHVPNLIPLAQGVTQTATQVIPSASSAVQTPTSNESHQVRTLRAGWMKMNAEIFAGKYHKPDAENPDIVNHLDWYEATGFTQPYPDETKVSTRVLSRKLQGPQSTPTTASRVHVQLRS